jgi:hypothetical protein
LRKERVGHVATLVTGEPGAITGPGDVQGKRPLVKHEYSPRKTEPPGSAPGVFVYLYSIIVWRQQVIAEIASTPPLARRAAGFILAVHTAGINPAARLKTAGP